MKTKSQSLSITPSDNCSTAPIIEVNTEYTINVNTSNYALSSPIDGISYLGNNIRGFWIAFKVPSNWNANHSVKIYNVSNNFDPVFGIRGSCSSPYLGHWPNFDIAMNLNGKGGNETSNTNLPGSENYGDLDNIYYIRLYHYNGNETPIISFKIIVE